MSANSIEICVIHTSFPNGDDSSQANWAQLGKPSRVITASISRCCARAAGTSATSWRSMPVYCEPWPGNKNAIRVSGRASRWKIPCCSSTV